MGPQGGVDARQQALGAGFLVTGGAVDLAGEIEAADVLGLQGVAQVLGIDVIVLDGVARPGDVGVLKPRNGAYRRQLDVERQAGGNAVGIQLVGGQPLRLHENLV